MSGLMDFLDREQGEGDSSQWGRDTGHTTPFSMHHLARDQFDPPSRLALAIQRRGFRFGYFESLLYFRPFNDSDPPIGGSAHAGLGGNTEVGKAYREALVATESGLPKEPGLDGNTMDEERRIFDACFDELQACFRGEIAVARCPRPAGQPETPRRRDVSPPL